MGKSSLRLLCRVISQIPLQQLVANYLDMLRQFTTSLTSWQQVVVMEFGKWHDTTDTTDFCPHQLVTVLVRRNWCNGFWLLLNAKKIVRRVANKSATSCQLDDGFRTQQTEPMWSAQCKWRTDNKTWLSSDSRAKNEYISVTSWSYTPHNSMMT